MKKILSCLTIISAILLFKPIEIRAQDSLTVVEVDDTTLTSVYYTAGFTVPTKLVFKNLIAVTNGYVYFQPNVNLVEVDFPKLEKVNGYFYFDANLSLKTISAPVLDSVFDYVYIGANTALTHLNICNLKSISQQDSLNGTSFTAPYYYISGNTDSVDQQPFCFSHGSPSNLAISKDSIAENQAAGIFIGTVSATPAKTGDSIYYYLSQDPGNNSSFKLKGDSLFSNQTFSYAVQNVYSVSVVAFNQLGESATQQFNIYIKQHFADTVTVEVDDTTLTSVFYTSGFTVPTKLLFKNLTTVTDGYVYFQPNVNLVEVDFPKLEKVNGYFYFDANLSLKTINAPVLDSVVGYVYIGANTGLTQLNICNLKSISPSPSTSPYYYISGNTPSVDQQPFCFTHGSPSNLAISYDSIAENQAAGIFIGTVSATPAKTGDNIYYSLSQDPGQNNNGSFTLRGDSLFSNQTFSYAVQNVYSISIVAFNQLGESATQQFNIYIKQHFADTVTVEVDDTTLTSVFYTAGFTVPTRLLFKNLTTVTDNYVYFQPNINLVEVDFPKLEKVNGYFYFNANLSLLTINAPVLDSVVGYVYIGDNTSLIHLNICNLKSISPSSSTAPYYYIAGNTASVDQQPFCFTHGSPSNIVISNDSVAQNKVAGTFIGIVSATPAKAGDSIYYSISQTSSFILRSDSLFSDQTFSYAVQNVYTFSLTAFNQLGESGTQQFNIYIKNSTDKAILPSTPKVEFANRESNDIDGWINYFYDNGTPADTTDDILLLSLKANGQNIGSIGDGTFAVKLEATSSAGSGSAVKVISPLITNTSGFWAMNRYWQVYPTYEPTSNVGVKFYYNNQDLADVNGSYPSHNLVNGQLIFYKAVGGDPNPTTNLAGANGIISILPANYPSDTTWAHYMLTDSTQYAEFDVASFSGGGGGATGNGSGLDPINYSSYSGNFIAGIYPNPVKDNMALSLSSDKARNAQVSIIDVAGRRMSVSTIQINAGTSTQSFATSGLAAGMYFVKIICDDGTASELKMVKQ